MTEKIIENRDCKNCGEKFSIYEKDAKFYARIKVSYPTLCPDCRHKRRITYRNERNFHHRKSDLTGEQIISMYPPEFKGVVYSQEEWLSDAWDPRKYGRDFDFNRSFFEQFNELALEVPRPAISNINSENSIYTNHSGFNKNCYMCINTGESENLMYCSNFNLYNKDCVDCIAIQKCELCYYCVNTRNSFNSKYLYECDGVSDSLFCYDCQGCSNCFGCWNLRHKSYQILNKQYSKEEYEKKLKEISPVTWEDFQGMFEKFKEMIDENAYHKAMYMEKCEKCEGDHLWNCKNIRDSYYYFGAEDVVYSYDGGDIKDSYDVTEPWQGELTYETHACFKLYRGIGCSKCWDGCSNMYYCQECRSASDCFGCFGMNRHKYCILNKQYSKEEYEKLVPRLIEHMKKYEEWGEFFPEKDSPFAYNESLANEYFSLKKEEVLKKGLKWREDESRKEYKGEYVEIPKKIENVTDEICDKILTCEITGRAYKIIPQELNFYKKMNLPVPKRCSDQRYFDRMALRNPRHLWERECSICNAKVKSTFSPERPSKILCEECYLKTIY